MDPQPPPTPGLAPADDSTAAKRWLGSTGWLILGRLVGSFCTFAILFQLARNLALPEFGRLTFFLALFAVLASLVDLGTGQTLVQRSARAPGELGPLLRTATRIRLTMACASLAGICGWAWAVDEPELGWIAASGVTLFASIWELTITPARNAMRLRAPVMLRAAGSVLALAAVSVLLEGGERRVGPLLFSILASAALANLGQHLWLRSQLPPRADRAAPWRPYLALTWPLGIGALCGQLAFWIDNAFIRGLLGDEVLGLYNLPVRLFSFSILVAILAPGAALPHLARAHEEGRLASVIGRMAQPMLALGAFGGTLLWVWGPDLLPWFGPRFAEALPVLRWLAIAMVIVHAGSMWTTALIAMGETRALLRLAAIGLGCNALGNLILLPSYGMEGAAAATILTELWMRGAAAQQLARRGVPPFSHWGLRSAVILGSAIAGGALFAMALHPALRWLLAATPELG